MSVQDLRAKFLSINASEEKSFSIIVDRTLRENVEKAKSELVKACAHRDDLAEDRLATLSEIRDAKSDDVPSTRMDGTLKRAMIDADIKVVKIDEKLVVAEQSVAGAARVLTEAENAAKSETVVLCFGKLSPDKLSEVEHRYWSKKDGTDFAQFYPAVAALCYRRATTLSGDDLDITWDEIREGGVTEGDVAMMWQEVLAFNRESTVYPR